MTSHNFGGLDYETDGFDIYIDGKKRKQTLSNIHGNKYMVCTGMVDGKQKHFYVANLIAEAMIEKPKGDVIICHKNGDSLDNRLENLEWKSKAEAYKDRPIYRFECPRCGKKMTRRPTNGICFECVKDKKSEEYRNSLYDRRFQCSEFYEQNKDTIPRTEMIVKLKEMGLDFKRIGKLMGVSRQRVHQIWQKQIS